MMLVAVRIGSDLRNCNSHHDNMSRGESRHDSGSSSKGHAQRRGKHRNYGGLSLVL